MMLSLRIALSCLFFVFSIQLTSQNIFTSVQNGNWDDASTWRTGAGVGGTEGIDYPSPSDEVYISSNDTVYLDFGTTGNTYEFEGVLYIEADGLFWVTVGDNTNGLSLINNARIFNRGQLYTGLSNEGPGTSNPYEIDIYLEDNSIYYAYSGSYNYCSDDIHIRDNAIFYTEVNVCIEIDDDFHLNGANSLLCGDGGASIGASTIDNDIVYESGASSNNICTGMSVFRGPGSSCSSGGTLITSGSGPSNLSPIAYDDSLEATADATTSLFVLTNGLGDIDLDGATVELIQCGSNGAVNDNLSSQGGTLSINDNGTPANFEDDYIEYTAPAGFRGYDSFQYIIEDDDGATSTATVVVIVDCGPGFFGSGSLTVDVYAIALTSSTGTTNAAEAVGSPDGTAALVYTNGNNLVLDMGRTIQAGESYVITWRERTGEAGTASMIIEESPDNSAYTTHPSPPTTNSTTFVESFVTANIDFRYLRISKNNPPSSTDFEIDGITYSPSVIYAGYIVSSSGVANPNDAIGAADGTGAQLHTNGNNIVVDMGTTISAGENYVITWRERTGESGTASMIIEESPDNSAYTTHPSPPTTNSTTFIESSVTANISFRYLRISKNNPPSTTDFQIDAVSYSSAGSADCTEDDDGDGVEDVVDSDKDNDGILDWDECFSTGDYVISGGNGGSTTNITQDDVTIAYLDFNSVDNSVSATINGTNLNANNILQLQAPAVAGEVFIQFESDGAAFSQPWLPNSNGLPRLRIFIDSDGEVALLGSRTTSSTVLERLETADASSFNNISFVSGSNSFAISNPNGVGADAIDGTAYIISGCDSDSDGLPDYLDLDSDNDGISDIIEAGGIDANGDGIADNTVDANGDGWFDIFDPDEGGTSLADLDSDGDGIQNRLDLDSDNDGITDNVEAQSSSEFQAALGSDADADGIDDRYDSDSGGNYLHPNDQDGDGLADYIDLDTDGDGLLDWAEGFDDNLSQDALDDLIIRADNFETAAGNPLYYINIDDADMDGVPDWLEDDDADDLLNFLDPDNAFYQDTDMDGLVDLFDTDNFGVASILPDNDSDGEPDFRDIDNLVSLPIELVSFEAKKVGSHVHLYWATSSEINNDYFTIERSVDGKIFTLLGKVKGKGNSSSYSEYMFIDFSPASQKNYYSLKQTDYDGTTVIKGIRVVDFNDHHALLKVYPNPSNGDVTHVSLPPTAENRVELRVLNFNGSEVYSNTYYVDNETSQLTLKLDLTPGLYLIKLRGEKEEWENKLIVVD